VVGLGNPGPRYHATRHNAGFLAIDELAARTRAAGSVADDVWLAEAALADEPLLLVKPQSFMNRSGEPVARLLAERAGSAQDLVVIVDDVALPLGRLRVRPSGSDGGHNGLSSIASALGTETFARVRIGIGQDPPPAEPLRDFVLADFLPDEEPRLREVIGLAADAVACLVAEGPDAAMNRFNGRTI
jgi:PTH1 family peptidyl-tRNA hydrolase